ncbi:hypothetical protein WN51_14478 [Melipona quadrifasciata]|uniref:Uncharacterized protein n=1 Tax=Melipona quadrifasciata TaxID=166423 RepID=A0A0N0U4Z1_9HYME|nr:hypothetical protein WN51_14478 [Melipona quadrifasciata]
MKKTRLTALKRTKSNSHSTISFTITITQIRVSNTRLAQAASGCAPSVDVLPIFDVKQQSVRNPARMGEPASSRFSYNNKRLGCSKWRVTETRSFNEDGKAQFQVKRVVLLKAALRCLRSKFVIFPPPEEFDGSVI